MLDPYGPEIHPAEPNQHRILRQRFCRHLRSHSATELKYVYPSALSLTDDFKWWRSRHNSSVSAYIPGHFLAFFCDLSAATEKGGKASSAARIANGEIIEISCNKFVLENSSGRSLYRS